MRHGAASGALTAIDSFVTPVQPSPAMFGRLDGDLSTDLVIDANDGLVAYASKFGALSPLPIPSVISNATGQALDLRYLFAISPTVKTGWILRVSEDLLDIQQIVTGRAPVVFPLSMQDITPYGNGLYHLNSILQPSTATPAPVVGVALTAEVAVPGSATGASQPADIELAVRFAIEVAKGFGRGRCRFYDADEWERIQARYGPMTHLQTPGRG